MLKIEKHARNFNISAVESTEFSTKYVIEPLYRGYGHTVGNALRRVLLSSIPGAAIKGISIDGVLSEFSVMEGVKEAVTEIILNAKEVIVKTEEHGVRKMSLSVKGPKVITAADIIPDAGLEIINPEQLICTVTTDREVNIEFLVDTGEGFVVSEEIDKKGWSVEYIAIDAIYSPIKKVAYSVQDTMVGRMTDFDKLTLDIETNGSVATNDALSYAVELLTLHIEPLLEIGNRLVELRPEDDETDLSLELGAGAQVNDDDVKIEELDLTVRSYNCLKKVGLETLGHLSKMSANDLMKIKNLGKKSYNEILEKMLECGHDLTLNPNA
jgi:DNA-directed RNA polymerase subunit alpha